MPEDNQIKSENRRLRLFRLFSLGVILFLLLTWLARVFFYVRGISTDQDATLELTIEEEELGDPIRRSGTALLWVPQETDKED